MSRMHDIAADPALISLRFQAGDPIDDTLSETARRLTARGLRVAGLIQTRGTATPGCACREMVLHDLATGTATRISEARGPAARGCHLDWQVMTDLAHALERSLTTELDLLIVNRFGRSEAEGQGLRGAIERAMALGVPVLVAHRAEYAAQWQAFHGGFAIDCPQDPQAIASLIRSMPAPAQRVDT